MEGKCNICGKELDNLNFCMYGRNKVCKECYEEICSKIDIKNLMYIHDNRERYNNERLMEVLDLLKTTNHDIEAHDIELYIQSAASKNEMKESGSKAWASFLSFVYYTILVALSIIGCAAGIRIGVPIDGKTGGFIGAIIGIIIGAFIGFALIAKEMLFITMCKDISTTTDNIAKYLNNKE